MQGFEPSDTNDGKRFWSWENRLWDDFDEDWDDDEPPFDADYDDISGGMK